MNIKVNFGKIQEVHIEPTLEEITITENGEYTPSGDGYSKVTVEVPVPDGYIIPEGTLAITENGTHDVTEYASAEVNVPSEEPDLEEITITANGEYTPSGDGYSKVTVEVESGGGIVLPTVKPSVTLATNIPVSSITANMAVTVNDISDLTITKGE